MHLILQTFLFKKLPAQTGSFLYQGNQFIKTHFPHFDGQLKK